MMNNRKQLLTLIFLAGAAALLVPNLKGLDAREFRGFTGIAGEQEQINSNVPEGCKGVASMTPVSKKNAVAAMYALAAAWNGTGFSGLLSADFSNKEQLLAVIADEVPRDAILTVLSVQSAQTIQQCEKVLTAGGKDRYSIVVTVARTQIEFDDPNVGYKRLEGTNEYFFRFIDEFR